MFRFTYLFIWPPDVIVGGHFVLPRFYRLVTIFFCLLSSATLRVHRAYIQKWVRFKKWMSKICGGHSE